ncbi:MAG TPA: sialate O-acetylesterase, partial [Flavisolibacter sp.]|nr:sialate O-acetylesterase [Flavisolibacter sp.]
SRLFLLDKLTMKKTVFALFLFIAHYSYAEITLPNVFGDNMVLQREKPIPVWGQAVADEKITVTFNQQTKTTLAGKDGRWMVTLAPEKAGGPFILTAIGKNEVSFNNVLVGEVWVCSGQSNMELYIAGWGKINNYELEIANANYPQIRHLDVPNKISSMPENDIEKAEWKLANPQNTGVFSAVAYFFAREIHKKLNVPVGIINSSWGGSMVETWISRQGFEHSPYFSDMIKGLPKLRTDLLEKQRLEAVIKKVAAAQGPLVSKEIASTWSSAHLDVGSWRKVPLPSWREGNGLSGLDGVVWFRKTFSLSAADTGKEATLELAMIDDNDISYVNGAQVGSTNQWNAKRKYRIPPGLLKEGTNSVAIRAGGGGGVFGDAGEMKLTIGGRQQPLAGEWSYRVESIDETSKIEPNDYPTLLFNAMIYPLIPFAIRGALWYQGEANTGRAYEYRKSFPLMIQDWRTQWKRGDFPFYFVQLSSFDASGGNSAKGSAWAELREAQTYALSLPNTGMAVTTDIGDAKDIHPKNKQDVGKRLATIALEKTYQKMQVGSGPLYRSMKVARTTIILSFTQMGTGLAARGGKLSGFEVAGADKVFHPATAVIKGSTVVVSSTAVSNPVAVRYGWADDAGTINLYNKDGFPASPFRTDSWKGITEDAKFSF